VTSVDDGRRCLESTRQDIPGPDPLQDPGASSRALGQRGPLPTCRADQPALVGEGHRLDPVPESQLEQYPAHVRLDRGLTEEQPGGDLGVGQPGRHEPQDVASAALPFSPLPHGAFALLGAVPAVVVGLRLVTRPRSEATVPA
jgi:hypothetical protein